MNFKIRYLSVTTVFLGLLAISFLASWFIQDGSLGAMLAFVTDNPGARPWTMLTYPFAMGAGPSGLITIVFAALWLLPIGSQVENDLSSAKYAIVLLVFTLLCSLFAWIGAMVTGSANAILAGPMVILEAVTIMWATQTPRAVVRIYGVFPVEARFIGWFGAALIFFSAPPQIAVFLLIPLGLLWAFSLNKLPVSYGRPRKDTPTGRYKKHWKEDDNYYADVKKREKEREERERLRKLFEGSISDEDK